MNLSLSPEWSLGLLGDVVGLCHTSSLRHDELRDGAVRSGGFPAVSADGISSSCPVGVHGNGIALACVDVEYAVCS